MQSAGCTNLALVANEGRNRVIDFLLVVHIALLCQGHEHLQNDQALGSLVGTARVGPKQQPSDLWHRRSRMRDRASKVARAVARRPAEWSTHLRFKIIGPPTPRKPFDCE